MVEDHRHCPVCGKPVEKEKIFCSPSCEELFRAQQEKLKRARLLSFLLVFLLLFLLLVLSSLSG
ncbi:MAG: DUF2116 family Zn-ribbon domain-containing protein [Candidatus Hadarchaeales archaeon]